MSYLSYNEAEIIPYLRSHLTSFFTELKCPVEAIFVNDGSSHETLDLLVDWSRDDSRIRVLNLSRNFGHQMAATAGLITQVGVPLSSLMPIYKIHCA